MHTFHTLVFVVGGVDLVSMESRSVRALVEFIVERVLDWKEEREGPPPEEGVELVVMGVASGMDIDCREIIHFYQYWLGKYL